MTVGRQMGRDDEFASGPYDLSAPPQWEQFPGLYPPLYTQTPDAFFDWVAPFLPEIELRVLIYLIRRTLGFKKQGDQITIDQIAGGIVTREGVRLDWGTQLGERSVQRGLSGLEAKGLIERHKQLDPERGYRPSYIRLRLCDQSGADWQRGRGGRQGGAQGDAGVVTGQSPSPRRAGHQGGVRAITRDPEAGGVGPDTYNRQFPQQTDRQETGSTPHQQETGDGTGSPNGRSIALPDVPAIPLWESIKAELAGVLAPGVFAGRVASTCQIEANPELLSVRCPDPATARWLEQRLGRKVAEIAALFADAPPRIRFIGPDGD